MRCHGGQLQPQLDGGAASTSAALAPQQERFALGSQQLDRVAVSQQLLATGCSALVSATGSATEVVVSVMVCLLCPSGRGDRFEEVDARLAGWMQPFPDREIGWNQMAVGAGCLDASWPRRLRCRQHPRLARRQRHPGESAPRSAAAQRRHTLSGSTSGHFAGSASATASMSRAPGTIR